MPSEELTETIEKNATVSSSVEKEVTILIVDDEAIIRGMLEAELADRYRVLTAENSDRAFALLGTDRIDLVISDINMPGMKGYDLLKNVKEHYPGIKTALITAYNIDDYIRLAKENNISNIITKSTPFNFDEFNSIVQGLVTEEIFGLQRYLLPEFSLLGEYAISNSQQIGETEEKILTTISMFHKPEPYVHVLLEELITNAVYHAPANRDGNTKYKKHSHVSLERNEVVKIALGADSEKYGVSVTDTSGRLTKEQVLFRLDRHIHAEGLLDENGRGLHMSRLYADRLIVNIRKNTTTEVIFINYIDKKYKGYKPLYINEL